MEDAAQDDALTQRRGVTAGVAAYLLWGLFPLVFHRLRDVGAGEILLHRILWSFVVVMVLLAWRGPHGWLRPLRSDPRQLARLATASVLIAVNWLVYIWAVNHDHVVEAALGYYINPLLTVTLGVVVLDEHLRRRQVVALGFGVASVVVLTLAYGRLPWIALVLATSFAGYSFQKKAVTLGAVPSLTVETALLTPFAIIALVVMQVRGDAAFLHGSLGRDVLLVALGIVTAVPLLLFAAAARRIPLSMLGLLQYLTPTGQLLCGVLVLGEPLPPERIAGFVLVWIALLLLAADALSAVRSSGPTAVPIPVAEPS
ncbi:MAG: chloramphenicol-sensitive protein RarD [Acidimicrobiaceae bacterium]